MQRHHLSYARTLVLPVRRSFTSLPQISTVNGSKDASSHRFEPELAEALDIQHFWHKRKTEWQRRERGQAVHHNLVITGKAGDGVNGHAAFHREKFQVIGPPSGSNGGRGGDVFILPALHLTSPSCRRTSAEELSTPSVSVTGHKPRRVCPNGTVSMSTRHLLPKLSLRRLYSSSVSSLNIEALDEWIALEKSLSIDDTLGSPHLADLYVTLPTRDITRGKPFPRPSNGFNLGYGHHLIFFHPRNPESALRSDGTDADFCPPEPFTRRMWAGGSMKWHSPLVIGDRVESISTVSSVEKKGFENGTPMVFVNQTIKYRRFGQKAVNIVEERSHVYLPPGHNKREVREVKGLRTASDFSFTYTPTATTLFRFSALTFNGHHIHLDKDYAQKSEGYPERLVHGPLTALMLLETVKFHHRAIEIKSFEYRARNPVIVNRSMTIHGAWVDKSSIELWTLDEDGVVGMTGNVTALPPNRQQS